MISVTDLKKGTVFEDEGQTWMVLSYEHIKLGRGSANIKVKVKNVRSGSTTEKGFINGAKVKDISVLKKEMQYLYKDPSAGLRLQGSDRIGSGQVSGQAYFMDPTTFEQIGVKLGLVPDHYFLTEGMNFMVSFLEGEPLSVEFPPKMEFVVADTGPSLRGNSATNIYKDAVLENGFKTKVPLFIDIGDKIRIDTRTGEYSERA